MLCDYDGVGKLKSQTHENPNKFCKRLKKQQISFFLKSEQNVTKKKETENKDKKGYKTGFPSNNNTKQRVKSSGKDLQDNREIQQLKNKGMRGTKKKTKKRKRRDIKPERKKKWRQEEGKNWPSNVGGKNAERGWRWEGEKSWQRSGTTSGVRSVNGLKLWVAEQPLELRQTAAACRLEQTTDHGQGGGAAAAAAGSSVGNLALGLKSARHSLRRKNERKFTACV